MIRKGKERKRITFGEVAKGLNQGLEQADPARLAGLEKLQRARAIKDVQLQREQARLTDKLGAKHPRVVGLAAKRVANRQLANDVAAGISNAHMPAVAPDPAAWVLHGHVRNQSRRGLRDLTVSLYDEKNQWIEKLGHVCTDANGYFQIVVKRAEKGEGTKEPSQQEPSPDAAREEKAAANTIKSAKLQETVREVYISDASQAKRGVYIHVTDNRGATLYAGSEAIIPKAGAVVYREIILDGDSCECTPPGKTSGSTQADGRYLGNKGNYELHDLQNATPNCRIDAIKGAHREYFSTQKAAVAAGYDFCAYCFSKEKSKR